MATIYSLVCWAGTGVTVTFTDAGDLVNWTDHGVRQYESGTTIMVKRVQFTTDGSLPTGLVVDTDYYAVRSTDNALILFTTQSDAIAGTNQKTFTGSGGGTHTMMGGYCLSLTAQQKARYGATGSERIYHRIVDCRGARYSTALKSDSDFIELAEAYDDYPSSNDVLLLNIPSQSCEIAPEVAGVKTTAYHNGVWGAGYRFMATFTASWAGALQMSMYNCIVRDFSVVTSGASGVTFGKPGARVLNMQFSCTATNDSTGCMELAGLSLVQGCVFVGFQDGFYIQQYIDGFKLLKNIFAKNRRYGAYVRYGGSAAIGFISSNICIGNATANWFTQPTGLEEAIDNSGVTGDTPWVTSGGATVILATTDFVDYNNNDFRPAAKTSPQVLSGHTYYGAHPQDLAGHTTPPYVNITHSWDYDGETDGPFVVCDRLEWGSDETAGTGLLLVLTDNGTTGSMAIHLTSGVAPSDNVSIASGPKSCDVNGSVTEEDGEQWAQSSLWSVGALEYYFGEPPVSYTLTIGSQNLTDLQGAQISIYDADGSVAGDMGTELFESNNNATGSCSYAHNGTSNEIYIQIIKPNYIEQAFRYALTASDQSVFIDLKVDTNE